jgi:site-specific recombinase XerD
MSLLAPTLQAFFSDRLMAQRGASPHTVAAYRDTFRLLLRYAANWKHKQPCQLDIADIDAPLVGAFLDHLEHERHNSIRTRNTRLAAIHALFGYAS